MSSDQMKKMLMLVESCSCEQSQEVEEVQVNELGGKNNPPEYGRKITEYFGKIGDYGDEGYEYLDMKAPLWRKLFDYADGDISAIIITEKPEVLKQAAEELASVVEDLKNMYGDPHGIDENNDFEAFLESVREMAGGQLDELSGAEGGILDRYRDAARDRHTKRNNGDGTHTILGNPGRNPREKGISLATRKLAQKPGYKKQFDAAYGDQSASELQRQGVHPSMPVKVLATTKEEVEQIDEISAKKAFGAAGKRAAQAVGNLAKTPMGAALSTGAAVAAGLQPNVDDAEAWLDRSGRARDKTFGVSKKAGTRAGQAAANLGRATAKSIGLEETYSIPKNPKGDTNGIIGGPRPEPEKGDGTWGGPHKPEKGEPKPKKTPSKDDADLPHFLESQSTEDAEFQSFMETLNYVMKHK